MQGNTISQRISLEGAQEIIRQLKEVGETGERAIKQIESAIAASNSTTASIGHVTDRIRAGWNALREYAAPVRESFHELRQASGEFGEKMRDMGDHIIPHFKEVLALATAGSVAGFVELIKSAADYQQELKRTADEMGVNVAQYQQLQFVMRSVGLDQERFVSTFTRLARSVGAALEEQKSKSIDLAEKLFGTIRVGPQIVGETADRLKQQSSRLIATGAEATKQIDEAAQILYRRMVDGAAASGQRITTSLDIVRQRLKEAATDLSDQGAKDRIEIHKQTGVWISEARTISEQLERTKSAGKDLDVLFKQLGVTLRDAQGNLRPLPDILAETASGLNSIKDAGTRAYDAQLIFNRGFKEILPLFREGGGELKELTEQWNKMNVALSDAEIELGSRMYGAFASLTVILGTFKAHLVDVFSPEIIAIITAIRDRIVDNYGAIINFARGIRQELKPGLQEIEGLIRGTLSAKDVKVEWVNQLLNGLRAIRDVGIGIVAVFRTLNAVMSVIADLVNYEFGTHLTGPMLIAIAIVGRLVGAFAALRAAFNLAAAAARVLVSLLGYESWTAMLAAFGPAGWIVLGIAAVGAAILTLTGGWDAFFKFMGEGLHNLIETLKAAWELAKALVGAAGRALSGPSGAALATPVGFSGGGRVPGSGSGDIVPARLEPEEFVVQKRVTKQPGMVDFLHQLNAGMVRMFAGGGLAGGLDPSVTPLRSASAAATSGSGSRTPLTLVIEGKPYHGLSAPSAEADRLTRDARTSAITSAGRAPSWRR